MGTRFYASEESRGHSEAKRRIVAAKGGETARSRVFDISRGIAWPEGYTGRVLRNAHLDRWLGHEEELAATTRPRANAAISMSPRSSPARAQP